MTSIFRLFHTRPLTPISSTLWLRSPVTAASFCQLLDKTSPLWRPLHPSLSSQCRWGWDPLSPSSTCWLDTSSTGWCQGVTSGIEGNRWRMALSSRWRPRSRPGRELKHSGANTLHLKVVMRVMPNLQQPNIFGITIFRLQAGVWAKIWLRTKFGVPKSMLNHIARSLNQPPYLINWPPDGLLGVSCGKMLT